MRDNLARTIAALRSFLLGKRGGVVIELYGQRQSLYLHHENCLALCDAAEASLRAAEREQKMREELEAVTVAASDPRINNTMSLEEWVREKAGLRCPPREPTREMTLAGQRALDNIWTSWHAPTTQCWRAMYDAWQNEQTGGKAMPATGLSSPDHAGSAGPPDHIEQTGGPIARGEPINQPELRSGPPDHQSAATPSNLSGGSSQEGADGPAADPIDNLRDVLRNWTNVTDDEHAVIRDAIAEIKRLRADRNAYDAAHKRQAVATLKATQRAERAEAERDTLAAIVRAADAMHLKPTMDNINAWVKARAKWEDKP